MVVVVLIYIGCLLAGAAFSAALIMTIKGAEFILTPIIMAGALAAAAVLGRKYKEKHGIKTDDKDGNAAGNNGGNNE